MYHHFSCIENISDVKIVDYPSIQSSVVFEGIRGMHFSLRNANGKVSKIAFRHSNTHLASFGFRHNSCYTLFRMYLLHSGKWGNFDTDAEIVFTAWELPNTLELQISSFFHDIVKIRHQLRDTIISLRLYLTTRKVSWHRIIRYVWNVDVGGSEAKGHLDPWDDECLYIEG